jgi:hypothetical protein
VYAGPNCNLGLREGYSALSSKEAKIMPDEKEGDTSAIEKRQARRISDLEGEVERLKKKKDRDPIIDSDSLKESRDTLVDVAVNLVRSAADAHFEFVRAVGDVLTKASSSAQQELKLRDDEDARDAAARIPSAFVNAVVDSLGDQSRAVDKAVSQFGNAFKKNRSDYKSEGGDA